MGRVQRRLRRLMGITLSRLVRENPEAAYEASFMEKLRAEAS